MVDDTPTPEQQEEYWRLQSAAVHAEAAYDSVRAPTRFEVAYRMADELALLDANVSGLCFIDTLEFMPDMGETGEEIDDDPDPELAELREELREQWIDAEVAFEAFCLKHDDKAFRMFSPEAVAACIDDSVRPLPADFPRWHAEDPPQPGEGAA